jgi:hypothetical protein
MLYNLLTSNSHSLHTFKITLLCFVEKVLRGSLLLDLAVPSNGIE